jgi:hypothetical protein
VFYIGNRTTGTTTHVSRYSPPVRVARRQSVSSRAYFPRSVDHNIVIIILLSSLFIHPRESHRDHFIFSSPLLGAFVRFANFFFPRVVFPRPNAIRLRRVPAKAIFVRPTFVLRQSCSDCVLARRSRVIYRFGRDVSIRTRVDLHQSANPAK